MNLIDKLLELDTKKLTEKETATVEIKRLSKLTGEPFLVTVQTIDTERYQELQMRFIDKKGKVDYSKAFDTNALIISEAVIEPNLADEKLQKHLGASTPKELVTKLFKGGELIKLVEAVSKVSGFEDDEEEEEAIKN